MVLLHKLKGKSFGDLFSCFSNSFFGLINRLWFKLLCVKPIDEKLIVFESNDDCCDNAYALFDYLNTTTGYEDYHFVWLVDHKENFKNNNKIKYVTKRPHPFFSYDTMKALVSCKWFIYDHVNVFSNLKKRKQQTIVYLCHGYAGFKANKGRKEIKSDIVITTGDLPLKGCYDFFGNQCNAITLGFSRLDYFYFNNKFEFAKDLLGCKNYKKSLIWMPTFRKCNIKYISEEYLNDSETGLPLLETEKAFIKFNDFLVGLGIQIIIKLHPLQKKLSFFGKKFSNIKFIDNNYLFDNNIQLYQIIPVFDALITDYSSVSTDYILLNKPIIYILDDYEEYKKSRGFYPSNPLRYMPGDHVYSYEQFENAVKNILLENDKYVLARKKMIPMFHKYQDGCTSKRIAKYLGIER